MMRALFLAWSGRRIDPRFTGLLTKIERERDRHAVLRKRVAAILADHRELNGRVEGVGRPAALVVSPGLLRGLRVAIPVSLALWVPIICIAVRLAS